MFPFHAPVYNSESLNLFVQACQKSPGCTAFDVTEVKIGKAKKKGKNKGTRSTCLLYGHTRVSAASAASPFNATCHKMVDEEDDDDVDPRDLVGNINVKLLGEGGCRFVRRVFGGKW